MKTKTKNQKRPVPHVVEILNVTQSLCAEVPAGRISDSSLFAMVRGFCGVAEGGVTYHLELRLRVTNFEGRPNVSGGYSVLLDGVPVGYGDLHGQDLHDVIEAVEAKVNATRNNERFAAYERLETVLKGGAK